MRFKLALAVVTFGTFQLLDALSASAQTIQRVAGGGLYINSPALQVSLPMNGSAVAYASNGTVYVMERNRVDRFNPSTGLITTVAGSGFFGYSGDGGPAAS
jgi:hypothetical protein